MFSFDFSYYIFEYFLGNGKRNGNGRPSNGYGAPPAPSSSYGAPPTSNYGAPPTNGKELKTQYKICSSRKKFYYLALEKYSSILLFYKRITKLVHTLYAL